MSTNIHLDLSAQNPYGFLSRLYTQTGTSIPIVNTTIEKSLIDGGLGSLSIPANGFKVGDSFHAILTGHVDSVNNDRLTVNIKANSVILATTGPLIMAGATDRHWKLEVFFTVRAIGPSGTAVIVAGGTFMYTKNASTAFEGADFSTETLTGFDTTVQNTLQITAQWSAASALNSISSQIFTLNKTY